jgi:adenine-specific DNA-methyltransferase
MATKPKPTEKKQVETLTHEKASRKNIPTAEYQSVMQQAQESPVRVAYERRNRDLDPQLVWRGKDEQDWSELVVQAPPVYIQEKVHPKVLIDDLMRRAGRTDDQLDLFADFNGLPNTDARTEFYQHDGHWSNRMILGDSLQVMASLAEREGLRGQVQCIYIDPPYGIKFNSNFQWSTTSRDVKDGLVDHITREPEQVKAFRDTWRDGVNSYLTYLRDRLTVGRDLLADSGSVFVQIGDENVHRVRAVLDEIFGEDNFVGLVTVEKTSAQTSEYLSLSTDYILLYAKAKEHLKFRPALVAKLPTESLINEYSYYEDEALARVAMPSTTTVAEWIEIEGRHRVFAKDNSTSSKPPGSFSVPFRGSQYTPGNSYWKTGELGFARLIKAARIETRGTSLRYVRFFRDFPVSPIHNVWRDVRFSLAEKRTRSTSFSHQSACYSAVCS